eukprot:6003365-Alexandrium_andersonii.AAC.1
MRQQSATTFALGLRHNEQPTHTPSDERWLWVESACDRSPRRGAWEVLITKSAHSFLFSHE